MKNQLQEERVHMLEHEREEALNAQRDAERYGVDSLANIGPSMVRVFNHLLSNLI